MDDNTIQAGGVADNHEDNAAVNMAPSKTLIPNTGLYSAEDLAGCARAKFGLAPELVLAAIKQSGRLFVTITEGEQIIKAFAERKVK